MNPLNIDKKYKTLFQEFQDSKRFSECPERPNQDTCVPSWPDRPGRLDLGSRLFCLSGLSGPSSVTYINPCLV